MKYSITQSIIAEHKKFTQILEDAIQERLDVLYNIFGEKFVDSNFGAVICSRPFDITEYNVRWVWEERWSYGGYEEHDGCFPIELLCSDKKFNSFVNEEKNKIGIEEQTKNDPGIYIADSI